MIVELLFNLIFGLVNLIIGLIPSFDVEINLGWLSGLSKVFQYIDVFCDVGVLLMIISLVVLRDNFLFIKNIIFALIRKIPFIG